MTAVGTKRAPVPWAGLKASLLGVVLVATGVIAGFGIAQLTSEAQSPGTVSYSGPMVERSLAMDGNHAGLIEWGRVQGAALVGAPARSIYHSPEIVRHRASEIGSGAVYDSPEILRHRALGIEAGTVYDSPEILMHRASRLQSGATNDSLGSRKDGVTGGETEPMVQRSSAMEENVAAVIEGGKAQAGFLNQSTGSD